MERLAGCILPHELRRQGYSQWEEFGPLKSVTCETGSMFWPLSQTLKMTRRDDS